MLAHISMNIFDGIEKLITEHGSATILRERLSLASDQYASLERKITELETKTSELESENQRLRLHVRESEKENQRLKKELEQHSFHDSDLSEPQLNVLQFLAAQPGYNHYGIAQELGITDELANFHLQELAQRDLAERHGRAEHRWEWHPTQEGRRYLVARSLL